MEGVSCRLGSVKGGGGCLEVERELSTVPTRPPEAGACTDWKMGERAALFNSCSLESIFIQQCKAKMFLFEDVRMNFIIWVLNNSESNTDKVYHSSPPPSFFFSSFFLSFSRVVLCSEAGGKKLRSTIQRSTETGLAVEMRSRMTRQASRESDGSMNSYSSEGK